MYALDRHHWLCALHAEGVHDVAIQVIEDLRGLDLHLFWRLLDSRGWCHPVGADGGRRTYDAIPVSLEGLQDDPFRSLASALRRAGGFDKNDTLFSEFRWADYLRRRIEPSRLLNDFEGALSTALRLSRRLAAASLAGLPGG